jgi:hypothetical protein
MKLKFNEINLYKKVPTELLYLSFLNVWFVDTYLLNADMNREYEES